MVTKAKRRTDILRSLSFKLSRKSIEKLYISYVRPILEYGAPVWDGCSEEERIKIEKVQIAGLRAISGAKKGTSHSALYYETKIEKLETRRKRQKLILFYKALPMAKHLKH